MSRPEGKPMSHKLDRSAGSAPYERSRDPGLLQLIVILALVGRAVDTSMASALLIRVAVVAPSPPVAMAASLVAQVDQKQTPESGGAAPTSAVGAHTQAYPADLQPGDILHVVRRGESLAYLGER